MCVRRVGLFIQLVAPEQAVQPPPGRDIRIRDRRAGHQSGLRASVTPPAGQRLARGEPALRARGLHLSEAQVLGQVYRDKARGHGNSSAQVQARRVHVESRQLLYS